MHIHICLGSLRSFRLIVPVKYVGRHVYQIEEVGDPGSVLSDEELIPTVEQPTVERPTEEPQSELESTREQVLLSEESLAEMDGTRENTQLDIIACVAV